MAHADPIPSWLTSTVRSSARACTASAGPARAAGSVTVLVEGSMAPPWAWIRMPLSVPASGTPTHAVWKSPSTVRTRVSVVNTWCALVERRIAVPAAARVA